MPTPKKMSRADKPQPVPNKKKAAAGGAKSSRKGVKNGSTKSGK